MPQEPDNVIRIFGAGYWRKGKAIYEHENKPRNGNSNNTEQRSNREIKTLHQKQHSPKW